MGKKFKNRTPCQRKYLKPKVDLEKKAKNNKRKRDAKTRKLRLKYLKEAVIVILIFVAIFYLLT